jgi:UDP-N-acetylmuramoyl-L-alanyl-D-glutamate--2,6-diaminopimelate ligase
MALQRLDSVDHAAGWLAARGARGLVTDSRRLQPGDAFIAWPGQAVDGRRFVAGALDAGASACLVEADGADAFAWHAAAGERIAAVEGLKARSGAIAGAFLGDPSARLHVLASTGTNGKTSTAWWSAQALTRLGRRCGVVGTLGIGEPGAVASTGLTTPDPVALQTALRGFVDAGFAACALEASSIGIVEQRLAGTRIEVALFTNFTQDHLDHHGSMEAYWQAKAALFDWPGLRAAVLNLDDPMGARTADRLAAAGAVDVWTYSVRGAARLRADALRYTAQGIGFTLHEGAEHVEVTTALIGDYNVSNLLAVVGGLRALGHALADIARVLADLTPVPGRMQRVPGPAAGPEVVVDYAHTPDALEKALAALQPFSAGRGGALVCVFGCGGNRDAGKRPLMGAIAQRLAGRVVLTSDNPRDEAPAAILAQIAAGLPAATAPGQVEVIEDRGRAIRTAVAGADPRDVILIAGKGHEDYQDVAGVKHPFSDVVEARAMLARKSGVRRIRP